MATNRIAGGLEKRLETLTPARRGRRRTAVALGILGACALGQIASTAHADLICKNAQGALFQRKVCNAGEKMLTPAAFGAGPQPAFHSRVASVDVPSVGWDRLVPVANVFVGTPGRYVTVVTANVRALANGDYVQCELYVRGRSRGRSVSVVPGLWSGESIALSTVDEFKVPGNVDLRCTDVEDSKNATLTDVRMTAFRVAAGPDPRTLPVDRFDLEAACGKVTNVGTASSPATTAYFPTCNRTVSIPALSPGQEHRIADDCGAPFIIDPEGLLNQPRANDVPVEDCHIIY